MDLLIGLSSHAVVVKGTELEGFVRFHGMDRTGIMYGTRLFAYTSD